MVNLVQKGDLAPLDFSNSNTNNLGGITVKTGAGSSVAAAITVATPNAADTVRGIVELAVAANYPAPTNDTDAATPAYIKAVVDAALLALPGDKFLQGLQSYNATTNVLTLLMSDSTTVAVDLTFLLNDAIASVTADKVQVFANDGTTSLGFLLKP